MDSVNSMFSQSFAFSSFVRTNDEGLTLEMSAFQFFQGGNLTFMNPFDKTKFSYALLRHAVIFCLFVKKLQSEKQFKKTNTR